MDVTTTVSGQAATKRFSTLRIESTNTGEKRPSGGTNLHPNGLSTISSPRLRSHDGDDEGQASLMSSMKSREVSRNLAATGGKLFGLGETAKRQQYTRTAELQYPIADVQPRMPELELPDDQLKSWHQRVAVAQEDWRQLPMDISSPTSSPSSSARRGSRETAEFGMAKDPSLGHAGGAVSSTAVAQPAAAVTLAPHLPPLTWYGCELRRICGQALPRTAEQLAKLQAWQRRWPTILDDQGCLWPLLRESATLFGTVAYYVRQITTRLANAVLGKAAGLPTSLRQLCNSRVSAADKSISNATVPLAPRRSEVALASLHMDVSALQANGSPLGAILRLLDAHFTAQSKMEELREFLSSAAEEKVLFMIVPCLEAASERMCSLTSLANRWQTDAATMPVSEKQSQGTPSEAAAEDQGDRAEIVEVAGDTEMVPKENEGDVGDVQIGDETSTSVLGESDLGQSGDGQAGSAPASSRPTSAAAAARPAARGTVTTATPSAPAAVKPKKSRPVSGVTKKNKR